MTADHFARDRRFWLPVLYAVPIGLLAGFAGLLFTQAVAEATSRLWPEEVDNSFLGGEWWWLALTIGAGLLVGVMRRFLHVPAEPAGALENISNAHVDQRSAIPMIVVSFVSLVGGASLGPFDAGTRSGGAVGEWFSDRIGVDDEIRRINTLAGINGSVGGLLTSPILGTLLITELNPPEGQDQYYRVVAPSLVGSVFGFFVIFSFVGATFLEVFAVPTFDVEIWHFGIAVLLGIVGAFLARLLGATVYLMRNLASRITNTVVRAGIGGLAIGLIAVSFPLTLGSGKAQLPEMIDQADQLGGWLLVAVVLAKILAMAVSLGTGFIGGPVMPTLVIGGAAGVATHVIIPDLPIALTLSCLLVAVPGASIKAPFAMALLAALTVGVGPITVAPAAVSVLTAYLLTAGLGLFSRILPGKTSDPDDPENVSYQEQLFELSDVPIDRNS
ncbi:MAG: chloride channel protein [Acidimicrobiales bacterium]